MTDDERNVVITGFMGTGKSIVARQIAEELGRPYVDMDDEIVRRAGKSIPQIFAVDGEATFRRYERMLCDELSGQQGLVIATGGGALVDDHNRESMLRSGHVICLDCEPAELLHRLRGDTGRPMLWADDPEDRLLKLLAARQEAYAQIPHHIDTTYRSAEQVVAEIVRLLALGARVWSIVTPTGSYAVHLRPGGLEHLGALVRAQGIVSRLVVVSDGNVWPLYGKRVLDGLWQSQYEVTSVVLPAGEQHKDLDTVRTLYDRFVEAGLDRSGAVIALGGGVITDMAGFAAATFMRGVSLVQVPTTLLGMVDASVGGKVAVDHPRGKNLIGAFVRPLLVMLDPWALRSLPETEFRAGLAEIIKAGIIGDAELFEAFEARTSGELDVRWLIERALQVKIDVVEQDPYETGRRAVLNLGHTFAHALEVLSEYNLHHGLAVSAGTAAAACVAEQLGLCSEATRERIVSVLHAHGLPTSCNTHPPQAVYEAMRADKKRRGSTLRFILPKTIGEVIIEDGVDREDVIRALERLCA
ncbi:MAG: 3-dehydroquinate synthase [Anaerolineae bacterium]|nr:3-dehydroquinate synthase [Anaerolineae bacterium]